ncbi:Wzz/FepE/Etk N-terminal domain-containing protein [Gammaproteobacteria bacterium]|nr:Wzz/FepE/Etk N-terminal domain-containing protein [Gammaproteobacteria bacterium]
MKNMNSEEYVQDEVDLAVLFKALFQGKWIIISFTSIASIIVVIYSLSLPNIYKAEALLVPLSSNDNVGGNLQDIGGLASLAGISLGDSVDMSAIAIEKLHSLSFFEEKILPQINLPDLMAVKSWNPSSNLITYDEEIYDASTQTWTREITPLQTPQPSAQESFIAFMEHVGGLKDLKTTFVTIFAKHQSPFIAKEWADLVIRELNSFYREKDKTEAMYAVDYLNKQLSETRLSEVKLVISEVLAQQIQTLSLIEANENYVFDFIDPPVVKEKKSEPRRAIICIVGALLGGFLGAIVALFRFFKPFRTNN